MQVAPGWSHRKVPAPSPVRRKAKASAKNRALRQCLHIVFSERLLRLWRELKQRRDLDSAGSSPSDVTKPQCGLRNILNIEMYDVRVVI